MSRQPLKEKYEELYDIPAMRRKYESGLSFENVAKHFPISARTLQNVFKECGIPARAPTYSKANANIDKAKVIALYKGGLSTTQVANALGCRQCFVYSIIKRAGIMRSISEAARLSWRTRK